MQTNIPYIDPAFLKFNCGESLKDRRLALCTVCDDSFLPGAQTLIYSFILNNPWFDHDIIIVYHETHSPLSHASQTALLQIYGKLIFWKVEDPQYSAVISRLSEKFKNSTSSRYIPSLFTFEAFDLANKYESLLFLDADTLVLSDISEVFNLNLTKVVVTPDVGLYSLTCECSAFNGGFLQLSANLDPSIKSKLLELALTTNDYRLADQSIMNSLLYESTVLLSSQYNCLKRCFPDSKFSQFDKSIKVVHYVGAKPWFQANKKMGLESNYKHIEKLWYNFYSKINNK